VAFTPKNWEDAPSNNTPISAAALEDMEIRTTNYSDGLFSIATRTSPIDAESYGVDGLGGDQSSALAAAMAAAATADRELQLPEGVIRINTKINMTNTVVRMRGHGPSNTIFEHNCPSEMLVFRGTLGTGTLLTANASAGAVSVVVTSASGITVGSRGIVRSTTAWPFTDKGAKKGELVRVVGVSGTTLTLAWPLEDDYVTADAAIFEPVSMVERPELSDFSINNVRASGSRTSTSDGLGIVFQYCEDPRMERITTRDLDNPGVQVWACLGGVIDGVRFYDSRDLAANSQYGYGVLAWGATRDLTVARCHMDGGRHLFTCGDFGDGTLTISRGVPRHILVTECVGSRVTNGAFDTHVEGTHITFADCKSRGGAYGFHLRAPYSRVRGADTERSTGPGVWVRAAATASYNATGCELNNVSVRHARNGNTSSETPANGQGIRLEQLSAGVQLHGIKVDQCDQDGIYAGGAGHQFRDVDIDNVGQLSASNGIRFATAASTGHVLWDVRIKNAINAVNSTTGVTGRIRNLITGPGVTTPINSNFTAEAGLVVSEL
jgi:hypothetical protein